MRVTTSYLLVVVSLIGVSGCEKQQDAAITTGKPLMPAQENSSLERWYSQGQVERGNALFQTHCASCHKPDASGTANWSELDEQGKLPPPPLNGTAHAWHHSLPILRRTIRVGGVPLGGTMPGFSRILNEEQIDDILAWVQSHWSDEIYGVWEERNQLAKEPLKKSPGFGERANTTSSETQ